MPTNDIKPFAAAGGANVLTQAEYLALAALSTGFSSGKANSKEVNKAIRQATFIASALAQFICDKSGSDVLDDGNVAGLVTKLLSAINKTSQPLDATLTALAGLVGAANKLPYFNGADTAELTDLTSVGRDIIGKTDIAAVLQYLGLGEAAKRDVGTGSGQIPDMSKWTSLKADYGWRLTPDGFLEQWGRGNYGNGDGDFVIPFPNRCVFVLISSDPNDTSYAEISQAFPVSNSKFRVGCATAEGNNVNPANLTCNWYAKGW